VDCLKITHINCNAIPLYYLSLSDLILLHNFLDIFSSLSGIAGKISLRNSEQLLRKLQKRAISWRTRW